MNHVEKTVDEVPMHVKSDRTTINELVNYQNATYNSEACAYEDSVDFKATIRIKEVLTINRVNDLKERTIECVLGMIATTKVSFVVNRVPYGRAVLVAYSAKDYVKHTLVIPQVVLLSRSAAMTQCIIGCIQKLWLFITLR